MIDERLLPSELHGELQERPVFARRIEALSRYDFSSITANLVDKGPQFSPEQVWPLRLHFGQADLALAEALELEFKRFMALALLRPNNVYAPPGPVDMYWHFFVLHTRDYADFCSSVWGDSVASPERRSNYHEPLAGARNPGEPTLPVEVSRSLPESTQVKLRALDSYDLSYFTRELVDRGRLFAPEQKYPIIAHFGRADVEVATLLESEFRRFVALSLIDEDAVLAPPGPVDMYWHFLILHTQDYRDFCDSIWGYFQHHPRGSRHTALPGDR